MTEQRPPATGPDTTPATEPQPVSRELLDVENYGGLYGRMLYGTQFPPAEGIKFLNPNEPITSIPYVDPDAERNYNFVTDNLSKDERARAWEGQSDLKAAYDEWRTKFTSAISTTDKGERKMVISLLTGKQDGTITVEDTDGIYDNLCRGKSDSTAFVKKVIEGLTEGDKVDENKIKKLMPEIQWTASKLFGNQSAEVIARIIELEVSLKNNPKETSDAVLKTDRMNNNLKDLEKGLLQAVFDSTHDATQDPARGPEPVAPPADIPTESNEDDEDEPSDATTDDGDAFVAPPANESEETPPATTTPEALTPEALDFLRSHETGMRVGITNNLRRILRQNGITKEDLDTHVDSDPEHLIQILKDRRDQYQQYQSSLEASGDLPQEPESQAARTLDQIVDAHTAAQSEGVIPAIDDKDEVLAGTLQAPEAEAAEDDKRIDASGKTTQERETQINLELKNHSTEQSVEFKLAQAYIQDKLISLIGKDKVLENGVLQINPDGSYQIVGIKLKGGRIKFISPDHFIDVGIKNDPENPGKLIAGIIKGEGEIETELATISTAIKDEFTTLLDQENKNWKVAGLLARKDGLEVRYVPTTPLSTTENEPETPQPVPFEDGESTPPTQDTSI